MILFIVIACFNIVKCFEVESYEVNRVENDYSPFYDMIVYSDVVDILNEFDNRGINGHPLDAIIRSESDSDENVDDLLSEYQRHIEKIAHGVDNLRKRAPAPRREHYPTEFHPPMRLPQSRIPNLKESSMPILQWSGYKSDTWKLDSAYNDDHIKPTFNTIEASPRVHKSIFDPSCLCKNNKFPCECDCKICIMPLNLPRQNPSEMEKVLNDLEDYRLSETRYPLLDYNSEVLYKDPYMEQSRQGDNTLNIKIKFEIQMPETQNVKGKHCRNHTKTKTQEFNDGTSIEITPRNDNFPSSFPQYPTIPLEILGLNKKSKINRPQTVGLQKLAIHKKKKSKFNNNMNKKHRKKLVTFHDIKFETPQRLIPESHIPTLEEIKPNVTNIQIYKDSGLKATQTTTETIITIDPVKEDKITVTLNLLNERENATNEIDEEPEELKLNMTNNEEKKIVRTKRDTEARSREHDQSTNKQSELLFLKLKGLKVITKDKDVLKKSELKNILADSELLYWPSNSKTQSVIESKDITTLIMERENKKAKINLDKDIIKKNRTKALEKAIFGDVDWDDMDAVTPIFMSFVGKYIRGVLTFCSDRVCHSMKCAEKMCLHRTCNPVDRLNHKGHCAVSNSSDSVASMESIMDLPSNVAFEIVDILQQKMAGKIYGKGTLCITKKCISFVAAKKLFSKSRCSIKDLNTLGHCSNIKNFKAVNK